MTLTFKNNEGEQECVGEVIEMTDLYPMTEVYAKKIKKKIKYMNIHTNTKGQRIIDVGFGEFVLDR